MDSGHLKTFEYIIADRISYPISDWKIYLYDLYKYIFSSGTRKHVEFNQWIPKVSTTYNYQGLYTFLV